MSFAAEMRDFFSAFQATSSVAGKVRDRMDTRANTFDYNEAKDNAPGMFGPGAGAGGVKSKSYTPPSGEIKNVIDNNVPAEFRDYAYKMAFHESRYNPAAKSPTGAAGLFQFTRGTGANYGLVGQNGDVRSDPALNAQAFTKLTQDNRKALRSALGREPTFGELALAHQQGAGGAAYLLTGKGSKKVIASIDANLAHNNIKLKGRDAAAKIAGFYGFDLGGQAPTAGEEAIPTSYTEWKPEIPKTQGTQSAGGNGEDPQSAPEGEQQSYQYDAAPAPAWNDTAALELPEGAKLYAPGDLTQAPTMYSAGGGSVPWGGETSYVNRPKAAIPTYRPQQTYGELEDLPDVAVDTKVKKKPNPLVGGGKDAQGNTYGTLGAGKPANVPQDVWDELVANGGYQKPPTSFSKNTEWHGSGFDPDYDPNNRSHNNEWHGYGANSNLGYTNKNNQQYGANNPGGFGYAVNRKNGGAGTNILSSKRGVPAYAPASGLKKSFAEGGVVEDTPEEAVPVAAATPAPSQAQPQRAQTRYGRDSALPQEAVTPAGNPRGSNREALAMEQRQVARGKQADTSNAIDAGLKYLTRVLGLDRDNAAVGPDPELTNGRRKLVNGAIGPNEGPPSKEEVDGIYQVVDPNNELSDGLKNVYAMKKGYDFYMQRGEPEKAAKFAAGVIQYSNLLSKQFGVAAVEAGKGGDVDGMVKYSIKAYDAIPDGLDASVEAVDGGYQVTRTDEDGDVVDQHMLTPQQIFQMATGISQGSGYFEALMDVASPGTATSKAKEQKAKTRAANLAKMYPDLKADMDEGEDDAWQTAVESGDYETLQSIMTSVKARRRDRVSGEARTKAEEDKAIAAEKKATDKAAAEATKDEIKRARSVKTLAKTKDAYETDMSEGESAAWDEAVKDNDLEGLKEIIRGLRAKRREPYYTPPEDDVDSEEDVPLYEPLVPPARHPQNQPTSEAPATSQSNPAPVTKVLNGVTYEKRGNEWFVKG